MLSGRFADEPLGITGLSHEGGQDWANSSPSKGSTHTTQPRGLRMRRTPCTLVWMDRGYEERWARFDALADKAEPGLFEHPLRGSYLATIQEWTYEISEVNNQISGSCVFVEYSAPRAVQPIAAGVSAIAGPGAMAVAVDRATAAAAAAGVAPSSSMLAALEAVEVWAAEDSGLRSIGAQMGSVLQRIDQDIALLKPTTWESWALLRNMLRVRSQLEQSGRAVLAEYETLIDYLITTGEPVLALARRLYGGANARQRAEEIVKLNGIKNPGMVEAGTKIKVVPP